MKEQAPSARHSRPLASEETTPTAFAGEHGSVLEIERYVSLPADAVIPVLCDSLVEFVGQGDVTQLADALAPLVASVQEDMALAGTFVREAAGI
jgi:hypothetical protein